MIDVEPLEYKTLIENLALWRSIADDLAKQLDQEWMYSGEEPSSLLRYYSHVKDIN